MSSTTKRQLNALTGIRFFLAIWVVFYHEGDSILESFGGPAELHRLVECFIRTGYAAVSAFFVLSGFVLTYNYDLATLAKPWNASRFAIARFSRIYPAYAIGLLMFVPAALYRLLAHIDGGPGTGAGSFALNVFLLQAWFPETVLTWNYPGWSLSNEAFFYAFLPLVGLFLARLARGRARAVVWKLVVCGIVLWVLSLALPVFAVLRPVPYFGDYSAIDLKHLRDSTWSSVICYNPLARLPEFCIGVVLALLYRLIPVDSRMWTRGAFFYTPAIAVILLVLASADSIPFPLLHNGLLAPVYAILFFGLALEGGIVVRFLSTRPLVFLGGASYSMYILHAPITAWMAIVFLRILHRVPHGIFWLICYLPAVVLLSSLFFRTTEKRLHQWLKTRLNTWTEGSQRQISVSHQ